MAKKRLGRGLDALLSTPSPDAKAADGDAALREIAVDLNDPDESYTLAEYQAQDFYENPGSLLNTGGAVGGGGFGGFGGAECVGSVWVSGRR